MRWIRNIAAAIPVLCCAGIASADSIQGSYIEARSVATNAGAEQGQASRAVLAWQVRTGQYAGEMLDGQTIIAVVTSEPSIGGVCGPTKTVFFIDSRLTAPQQRALVRLAKDLATAAIRDDGQVVLSKLDVRIAEGCGCGAAVVACDLVKFRTRRMTDADSLAARPTNAQQPLGDVFTSTEVVATDYTCAEEPLPAAASEIIAFAGSFSR